MRRMTKARKSWVVSANGHAEFPIQNLPLGVFRPKGQGRRGGVAIGDEIFDLDAALDAGLFAGDAAHAAEAAAGAILNPLMALGKAPRVALRRRLCEILDADGPDAAKMKALAPKLLHEAADCTVDLPAEIGDYTDFFAGIHHATNVGKHVPAGQSAAAQLQIRADRLSRPRLVDPCLRRAGAAARRAAQAGERDRAELRPVPQSRLRARARHLDRPGQRAGRA